MGNLKFKYDSLIYYSICDTLYIEKKNSDYSTYRYMYSDLKNSIESGNISIRLYKIMSNTLSKIEILYDIEYLDAVMYLLKFIEEDMSDIYIDLVIATNNFVKNANQSCKLQ